MRLVKFSAILSLMHLHLIAIGKKKSEYDTMIAEYQKRITAPFDLTIEILEPLGIDHPEQSRIKESEKLLGKIKSGDLIIALDETGKDFTTVAFAQYLNKQLHASPKRIVFIIGGAYGLEKSVLERTAMTVCLGKLTLPHELARLVLVEQLYRVTNFIAGGKYHHS